MNEITIPMELLDQPVNWRDEATVRKHFPGAVVTINPPGQMNIEFVARGPVYVSDTETPIASRAILACYTREPPPDWDGDPLAPSSGEVT